MQKQYFELKKNPNNYQSQDTFVNIYFQSFEHYQPGESGILYLANQNLSDYNDIQIPQQLQQIVADTHSALFVVSAQTEYLNNYDASTILNSLFDVIKQIRMIYDFQYFGVYGSDIYGVFAAALAQNYIQTIDYAVYLKTNNSQCQLVQNLKSLEAYLSNDVCNVLQSQDNLNNMLDSLQQIFDQAQIDNSPLNMITLGCILGYENQKTCQELQIPYPTFEVYQQKINDVAAQPGENKQNMQIIEYEIRDKNDLVISEIDATGLIGGMNNNLFGLIRQWLHTLDNLRQN